jgi:hypothetical protein
LPNQFCPVLYSSSVHWQIREELGEVGFDDFVGEGDSEGAFFGGGAGEAFVEGLADDLAGGGAFEAEDFGDLAAGDLAFEAEFGEEFDEGGAEAWIEVRAGEVEVGLDALAEVEWLDEADHEVDLVEHLLEEVDAEFGQALVGEVAFAVVVVVAFLVGVLEARVVGGAGAGESAGEGPEAFAVEA